jgi:hypothetical protein
MLLSTIQVYSSNSSMNWDLYTSDDGEEYTDFKDHVQPTADCSKDSKSAAGNPDSTRKYSQVKRRTMLVKLFKSNRVLGINV